MRAVVNNPSRENIEIFLKYFERIESSKYQCPLCLMYSTKKTAFFTGTYCRLLDIVIPALREIGSHDILQKGIFPAVKEAMSHEASLAKVVLFFIEMLSRIELKNNGI